MHIQPIAGVEWLPPCNSRHHQHVFSVLWPPSLQQLSFGRAFNQPIGGVVWSPSLQKLSFGDGFNIHPTIFISLLQLPSIVRNQSLSWRTIVGPTPHFPFNACTWRPHAGLLPLLPFCTILTVFNIRSGTLHIHCLLPPSPDQWGRATPSFRTTIVSYQHSRIVGLAQQIPHPAMITCDKRQGQIEPEYTV